MTDTLVFLPAFSSHHHHCRPACFPHQPGLPICQGSLWCLLGVLQWTLRSGLGLCDRHPQCSPGQPPACDRLAPHDQSSGEDHPLLQWHWENHPSARNKQIKISQKEEKEPMVQLYEITAYPTLLLPCCEISGKKLYPSGPQCILP